MDLSTITGLEVAQHYARGDAFTDEQIGIMHRCGNRDGWAAACDPSWRDWLLDRARAAAEAKAEQEALDARRASHVTLVRQVRALEQMVLRGDRDAQHAFLMRTIGPLPYEVFVALHFDGNRDLIATEELAAGDAKHVPIHPPEIVQAALRMKSAAVLVAHNHPGGFAGPSAPDLEFTTALRLALAERDIALIDHLIVTATSTWSLLSAGQL